MFVFLPPSVTGSCWTCRSTRFSSAASRALSFNSRSTAWCASSSVSPPPFSDCSYWSLRCWSSSSTISASRVGERPSPDNRLLICPLKSGMLDSCDPIDRANEFAPAITLRRQNPFAGGS